MGDGSGQGRLERPADAIRLHHPVGPAAVFQTVWTLRLANKEQRDRFYEWLCDRLDRWQSWADMASEYGSAELTHHLLQVAAAALVDGEGDRAGLEPPPRT